MPGSNMNAGLDAGANQSWYGAGSVLGPDFGKMLTSLIASHPIHLFIATHPIYYSDHSYSPHLMIWMQLMIGGHGKII